MDGGGIYQIVNRVTGDIYIGSSIEINKRLRAHRNALTRGDHFNTNLQRSWNSYGGSEFSFEILEAVVDRGVLIEREQHYIDTLRPQFNKALRAGAAWPVGRKRSDEERARAVATTRARGKMVRSPELRRQISESLKGRKGRSPSQETRAAIAKKLTGHPVSEETRRLLKEKNSGWHHTPEAKAKIGAAGLGRKPKNCQPPKMTPEIRAKISAALSGKRKKPRGPVSEQTKERIRQSRLAYFARIRKAALVCDGEESAGSPGG